MTTRLAILALLSLASCSLVIDVGTEGAGRPCLLGECPEGFRCNEDGLCEIDTRPKKDAGSADATAPTDDAGEIPDTGSAPDVGLEPVPDTGGFDAAIPDTGALDAGVPDAAGVDAGLDAGFDASLPDAAGADIGYTFPDAGEIGCGNGTCSAEESCGKCPEDCGTCPSTGGTFHVSPSGSDLSGDGSVASPWATLQRAIGAIAPGDTVVVRGGTYPDRVTFSKSGASSNYVTFTAAPGETVILSQGFLVSGSYNRLVGFEVTPGPSTGKPIEVTGDANVLEKISHHGANTFLSVQITGSNNTLRDIDFHDCGALVFSGSGSNNLAKGGTLHHTRGILASLEAPGTTLDGLVLHDPGQSGASANGILINAAHVTVRNCAVYNVFKQDTTRCSAFNWFNRGDDLVIEGNTIGSRAVGGGQALQDQGHIWFETNVSSNRVILRNNVFLGTENAFSLDSSPAQVALGAADDWEIVGNTFFDQRGLDPTIFANMRNARVMNNVFTSSQPLAAASGSLYDYNAYIGVDPPVGEAHSFKVLSPMFVNADVSAATGYGVSADLHPQAGSPLVGKGLWLPTMPRDKAGKPRPSPPTVGAYEP